MRVRLPLLTILLLLVPFTALGAKDEITKELITAKGVTRAYYLFVPSVIKATPAPLIVTLHGSGRNGISLVEKWKELAKKEGIIVAGPDSQGSKSWRAPQDGPEFLHSLVEELKVKYPINPRRVYLFGHSAGASFSLQMSLLESEYFAAAAIHAGALQSSDYSLVDLAKRKIPIFIQVGDSDQYFPLDAVRATKAALNEKGFSVQLTEIPGHDHWYYDMAPKINRAAWDFLKTRELAKDPHYDPYDFG